MNEHKLNAVLGSLTEAATVLGRVKHLKKSDGDAATVKQNIATAQSLLVEEQQVLEQQREVERQRQGAGRRLDRAAATEALNFGEALEVLKGGGKVTRSGWNGAGMWLRRYDPYSDTQFKTAESPASEGTLMPWIGMKTADNGFVPWLPSQADLLATDWQTV